MGEFQALHKYLAFVVILIASHEVDISQGRQIKVLNQHSRMNKDTNFDSNVPTSAVKAVDSPTPNHHVNAISEDSNGDHIISAYRPTTPGNSPGVGHRKSGEENKDIKAKVVVQSPPDVEYSLAEGSKTDFRPTDPGHSSPGVGHGAHPKKNNGELGRVQNQLGN